MALNPLINRLLQYMLGFLRVAFVIIPRLYTTMQGRDMVRIVLWISYIFL
jgi:hypothetical protein